MNLLVIVLVLAALRLADHGSRPQFDMARRYLALLRGLIRADRFWQSPVSPWLVVLLPVVLLAATDACLPWYLQILLAAVVLWLCVGPRELAFDVRAWLAARSRGDAVETEDCASRLWGQHPNPGLGALFVISHERLFGVLLWFCAFGPAGALLYHLGQRLPALWPQGSSPAEKLHAALAYVPARLTTLLFAMAGSADDVIAEWRRTRELAHLDWAARTWAWLSSIAAATVIVEESDGGSVVPASLEESAREFIGLEFRALLIMLAFVAIFTVGNWFG
jgi:AmpE protein